MSIPIQPGTARRLGLRRPGKWEETWERSDRPGWGSADCQAAWTTTIDSDWSVTARPGGFIAVDKQLTDAELDELRAKWLAAVAKGGRPEVLRPWFIRAERDPAPRRRWWQRRKR